MRGCERVRHVELVRESHYGQQHLPQWVCGPIHGLATAVDWLCDGEPSDPPTRAWRLDPDRIFWFYSKSNRRGVLAIHDFELPCNHVIPASSALMEEPSRRKAHDYLAPESVYANHIVAGPSDVWTLGCFVLEMACWMLGGAEALAQFAVTRTSPAAFARHISSAATFFDVCYESDMTEESGPEFFQCDPFYQTQTRDQSGEADEFVFRVHRAATMFMSGIHAHPACPEYIHDLVDLVEKQMLLVNLEKRAKLDTIVSKMASMLSSSVHPEYLSEPCPRPRNGFGLDGKAVLAFSDSSHQHSQLTRRPLKPKTAAMVNSRGLVRPLAKKEIRLLNLLPGEGDAAVKCTIRVVPLTDTTDQYETLSYVWGEPLGSVPIHLQGREVKVTPNLYAALRRLRNPVTSRTLWIDQLCINQWDDDEKAEQIKLMRDIYEGCSQCLVWLGELATSTASGFTVADAQAALSFLTDVANTWRYSAPKSHVLLSDGPPGEAARRAFQTMFMQGNPWWSRIWTVQEAILPPSCTLLWGSLSIPWDTLRKAAANLCGEKASLILRSREMRAALEKHSALIDGFMYPVRGVAISGRGESSLHLLQRWRYRDATEPRDKFYGLMGLFPAASVTELESGYSDPAGKLFGALTMGLIRMERNLRPLVGFRGEPQVTPDIPSWALDLVRYDYGCATRPWKWWNHSHRYDKFDASRGRAVDFDGDYARGVLFDYIADVGDVLGPETWDDLSDQTLIQTVRSWESLVKKPTVPDQTGTRTKVYKSLRDMVINQAFFITKTGYMGIGPPNIENKDEVWILDGGNVPFVLRGE
ncbi:hypothetical protein V8F33_006302 [Rhypophila sp. PSN 637]